MEKLRTALSVACGVLIGLGMAWSAGDHHAWSGPRIVVGLLFGVGAVASLIRHPERLTRGLVLYGHVPLMIILIAWVAHTETLDKVAVTMLWSLLFLGVSFAMARLNIKPKESS